MSLKKQSDYHYEDPQGQFDIFKNITGTCGWIVMIRKPEKKFLCVSNTIEQGKQIAENYLREQGLIQ